MIEILIWDS